MEAALQLGDSFVDQLDGWWVTTNARMHRMTILFEVIMWDSPGAHACFFVKFDLPSECLHRRP